MPFPGAGQTRVHRLARERSVVREAEHREYFSGQDCRELRSLLGPVYGLGRNTGRATPTGVGRNVVLQLVHGQRLIELSGRARGGYVEAVSVRLSLDAEQGQIEPQLKNVIGTLAIGLGELADRQEAVYTLSDV